MHQAPIHCTEIAKEQIQKQLQNYKSETGLSAYVQISIKPQGCSGLSYEMDFAIKPEEKDYILEDLKIIIKANSLMLVMGTEIDYEFKDTSASFLFKNPAQKRSCHCGKAFYT